MSRLIKPEFPTRNSMEKDFAMRGEDDPLMPLLSEAMRRLLRWDGKWSITWLVGDQWVVVLGR